MKNITRLFFILAAMLTFAACNKEKEFEAEVQRAERVRDITYTIGGQSTTVHLKTEAEWDTLLGRFCDYAQGGDTVTFHNVHAAASQQAKENVTFSTSVRETMKRWMSRMEDEGMTVTLTYDPTTHTWHGTAYATAPQPQATCYTGVLVLVSDDLWNGYGQPPYPFWALKINEDTTILTSKRSNTPFTIGDETYQSGDTVTICGYVYAIYSYDYTQINYHFSSSPREDRLWRPYAIYFCDDGYSEGLLMITVDDDNHKLYCTSTYNDMTWQGSLGGGVFRYEETDQTDNLGHPIIMVYNDATQAAGKRFSIARHSDGAVTIRDLDNANMPNNGQLWLNCSYVSGFETWACDTMDFNIVIHNDIMPLIKYPPHGYSSSPFYASCTTPFEAGKYNTNNPYSFSHLSYEVSGRTVNFNVEESDDNNTLTLTPVGEPDGCLDSYVFHRIERKR